MQNFSIGLRGLNAAQTALDTIGNNVANAATEGYHRQRIELAPASGGQTGGGVDVAGITRMIDTFLESEIMRQESSYGQVSQELSLLSTVETAFGEFSESGGLNATIDQFFSSLRALAADPAERVLRHETISSAQVLTDEFRRLGSSLKSVGDQIVLEAQNTVDSINQFTGQIAGLNAKIQAIAVGQGQGGANNLCDQRDRLITDLAGLVGVETQPREYGIVDVSIAGIPVVTGSVVQELTVSLLEADTLTIRAAGAQGSSLTVEGGRLGGLLSLKSELIGTVRDELDTLARTIVEQVNRSHVQGLGLEGSFRELTGWALGTSNLTALGTEVTDGTLYLRVTNTTTGEIQRYAVPVQVSGGAPDTPASIAAKINALPGVNASINSSRLCLVADAGYTFDFLPQALPKPTATNFTAVPAPTVSVSGLYEGEGNHVFTFTASGAGSIGNGSLQLAVRDEGGNMVGTVDIGEGYAAGDPLVLDNGLKIALSTGALNAGNSFQVAVFADTDTSGFLAAVGMNTFFSGASASEMRVSRELLEAPDRIATALGRDLTDNLGALRLAALGETGLAGLTGMTMGEYYQRSVANLGQQVSLKQARQENVESMLQSLRQQRSDVSSVNINDEAAQLLVFQQMFEASAKYMSTLQAIMATLMEMV